MPPPGSAARVVGRCAAFSATWWHETRGAHIISGLDDAKGEERQQPKAGDWGVSMLHRKDVIWHDQLQEQ